KPASTAAYSSYFVLRVLEEAGLPPGVINLVYGSGATIGDAALASPDLAGVHFTGSTGVFHSMWKEIGANIDRYRNYPRIVGETGGKDFIVAHPSANVEAVATAVVRGSFEYQGQKCPAASRVFAPSNHWPELAGRQPVRERQADGCGRRPAAVRRRARLGHERQGGLDVEPDPLGQPTHDQGDVRPSDRLPVSVHGLGRRPRLARGKTMFPPRAPFFPAGARRPQVASRRAKPGSGGGSLRNLAVCV